MRRTIAVVLALMWAAVAAGPARAEDQASLKAQLAEAAQAADRTDQEVRRLDAAIADHEQRVDGERRQLRELGRALYKEPGNPLVAAFRAPNFGEALTAVADLMIAGERVRTAQRTLQTDLEQLRAERSRLLAERQSLSAEQTELRRRYARLVAVAPVAEVPPAAPMEPSRGSIPDIIRQAWAALGPATADWAVRLAKCESGLNPYAVNRSSGASGLFQFLPSTWAGTPWAGQSPFDPVANAAAAAWLYKRSGPGQWVCRG